MTFAVSHPALRGRSLKPLRARRGVVVGVSTPLFWALAIVVLVLNFFGTLMIVSSSSVESVRLSSGSPWVFAQQQIKWTVVGLVLMLVTLCVSVHLWRRLAVVAFWLSLVPLAAVLVPAVGASKNGAARWIDLGPINFQPSEFVKLTMVLVVAEVLTRRTRRMDDWRGTLLPAFVNFLPVAVLIMLQPNLGTTLIIATAVVAMVWVSGVPARAFLSLGLLGVIGAGAAVLLAPFRFRRFTAFLDLRNNLSGTGYQPGQALVGFANGGFVGRGLGRSTIKWGYLPYPYNDYILAVIGEELGLLGTLFVVALFVTFVCVGAAIARATNDRFARLVAAGITAWIGGQALLNMAVVTSVVPSTGVPLPFISFGGSAQIVNLVAVGMLLNIARHPRREEPVDPEVEAVHRRFESVA